MQQYTLRKIGLKHEAHSCSQCSLGDLCLPVGMSPDDMVQLEDIVEISKAFQDGETAFKEGAPFETIFAVKSGMFKTISIDEDGNESVLGFHLPGELIGLDAIYPEKHVSSAVSVGTSSVCVMSYEQLTGLASQLPTLQHQLLRLLSKEVNISQSMASDQSADQKLAAFILGLSTRYKQRGYSGTQFNLAMPRRDIANHLGMAAETISRILKRFQEHGLVSIQRRELIIDDMLALKELAGCASAN